MSHLLREHAPITERVWALHRRGGARAPGAGARRPQARRLRRPARLGALGHEPRPHRAAIDGARARASTAAQRRVLPLVELRARFTVSRGELRDADRGADDADFDALDEAAHRLAVAENTAVFHGFEAAGSPASPRPRRTTPIALGDDCERYPRHVAKAVEPLLASRHRRALRARARARRLHARARDQPSTAATRCSTTCARSSAARSCGRPASTARSS